jgi:hypothetical protein
MELPLARLAHAGDVAAITRLVEEGADVNARDAQGATALHYAARAGRVDVIQALLAMGATLQSACTASVEPTLHWAARGGSVDALEYLVRSGAAVSAVNADGACAVHVAAGCGHVAALTKARPRQTTPAQNPMQTPGRPSAPTRAYRHKQREGCETSS